LPELLEFVDARGRNRYSDWLEKLDASVRVRIVFAILRLEQGNFGSTKSVGAGVSELHLDFGPGYRVYFGREADRLVILLLGGSKRRQQADIELAHMLWAQFKREKRET